MNDLTFMTLKIVVSICSALITFFLIPYLYEFQKDTQNKQLFELVATAVKAAEQTIKGEKMGADKKNKVMDSMREYAHENHLSISDKNLSDLIESAVYELKVSK